MIFELFEVSQIQAKCCQTIAKIRLEREFKILLLEYPLRYDNQFYAFCFNIFLIWLNSKLNLNSDKKTKQNLNESDVKMMPRKIIAPPPLIL